MATNYYFTEKRGLYMNNDNNFQQPDFFQTEEKLDQQSFSGVDNSYQGGESDQFFGEVAEPDNRPGCLVSLLGFILTIALMITLTAGLILLGGKSSLTSGIDVFFDVMKDYMYDELSNNTKMKEALSLVDCEFSDFLPDKMLDDMAEGLTDSLTNGIDPDNILPELDYDYISDSMYNVTEKVVDKALDGYIYALQYDVYSEETELLNDYMVNVIGYDLQGAFNNTLYASGASGYSEADFKKAKEETMNTILPEVREQIDELVYTDFKTSYEESFNDSFPINDEVKQAFDIINIIPVIMKGCLIAAAVIILLQLIIYRQKYRAVKNISVASLFTGLLFSAFYGLLSVAVNNARTQSDWEEETQLAYDVIENMLTPFLIIGVALLVAFVVLFILQMIMRSNSKKRYI